MLSQWHHQFPDCEPVAHWLRAAFPDRWVRFHSLPGSKRYPEDESEYATVLHRHNRILCQLVGSEPKVVLLTTSYSNSREWAGLEPELILLVPDAVLWRTIPMHELEGEIDQSNFWHVSASIQEWHPGLFDPIVRLVADDVLADVMIVDPDCRWVLHPYDGGMDVIMESSAARDRLKSANPEWLSAHPAGL
jgi:hypothetical protein